MPYGHPRGSRAANKAYYKNRAARQRRQLEKMRGHSSSRRRKKSSGCYIATAVYGSYDCPQVWALRRYRDQFLSNTCWGRGFIKFYYTISPTVVSLLGDTKAFNAFWRRFLDKKVERLLENGYKDTPYTDK